ncbi:hypothetical protein E2562_027873 [Oryza meyeriana var. granulata]|uniref:DUF4283 domain-containing protein n=1 Tax=Oryza meyeriana var. granulata TaxID=110450 RepID=A0A6G1CTK3_9ORYZ|nr:hypothetical protein E2562_027873 [Oryza meyeriana var. granulata]
MGAREVAISLHHPEAFLIKFQHRHHYEDALKKGFAKCRGIEVHFTKWRSLKNALGVALMSCVKLCLDGVPMHVWVLGITEWLISCTCTLEQIETDLVHPVESGDTRVIHLWVWTTNPSCIPKRVRLGIINQARDPLLESMTGTETPLEH